MKRRLAWLALPLVLLAIVLGVKWRIDHPTPTKLDLQTRARLAKFSKGDVSLGMLSRGGPPKKLGSISAREIRSRLNSLYLTPHIGLPKTTSNILIIRFAYSELSIEERSFTQDTLIFISPTTYRGYINTGDPIQKHQGNVYQLHPVTVESWMEFLLAHPHIGPELRKRMNN